jgi:DNA-binding CsgD family transcriptional regulator
MSDGFQALSEREKETLRLLLSGHDIKSIAAGLGLSVHTVNERLREARRKLGATSSRQAARILAEIEQGGPHFSADKEFGVVGATVRAADHGRSYRLPGGGHSLAWLGGGMLVMSLIVAAAVLTLVLHGGDRTLPSSPTRISTAVSGISSPSEGMARGWLAVVDGQGWDASWNVAGDLLRSQVPQAQWASQIQALRQPLGPVSSRVFQGVTNATAAPGLPDGQYEMVRFATRFAQKADAIETVVMAREAFGWMVEGYSVK